MSQKFPGGFITKSPVAPTTSAASGIWTLDQQEQYQKAGTWPQQPPPPYIEDVFSTYLYTGTDATQTITNGIDLSTYGGLVWIKNRTAGFNHNLQSTGVGFSNAITSSATTYASTTDAITGFNTTGFNLGSGATYGWTNNGGSNYVSWSFRKQAKFFDVVTWTGNGTAGRTISHNLGSVPGAIFVKRLSNGYDWEVYHTSIGNTKSLVLNDVAAAATRSDWNNTTPTSTQFTVGSTAEVNASGGTYIAYLFAHNAGGFGATETDNVISCGSYTGTGAVGPSVNLGYEPQWLLIKRATGTSAISGWYLLDNMRGIPLSGGSNYLRADTSDAETNNTYAYATPTATGFNVDPGGIGLTGVNFSGETYIYIAIRRGPMKTPTSGTSVFSPVAYTGNGSTRTYSVGFPTDISINMNRNGAGDSPTWNDRLRGSGIDLYSNITSAEANNGSAGVQFDNQTNIVVPSYRITNATPYIDWCMRRAPSFFDEVCWTGTGSGSQAITHNLGVVPEFTITKRRSGTGNWSCFPVMFGVNTGIYLDSTAALQTNAALHPTLPTATTYYTNDASWGDENIGGTFVTYLFATCLGVSKVGTYTGTGATQTISCGFTGGARFVLVKRTDTTGDWYVWDTARGMVSGTDPSLLLNTTGAEVNANSIYTTTGGFQIVSTAAGINASGGSYIYLAIA